MRKQLPPAISALLERHKRQEQAWEEHGRSFEREWAREMKEKRKMLRHLRPATVGDYLCWLKGFLARGGKPTHYYDYSMPSRVYVATKSLDIYPLFGAAAIEIIVPEGIEVRGEPGHSALFEMKDFKAPGGWVPVWADILSVLQHE